MSFKIVPSVPVAYGRIVKSAGPHSEGVKVSNPLALMWHWMTQGAHRIHIEEMSPASPHGVSTLPALLLGCQPMRSQIQVGGGIRDAHTARLLAAHGADTLVLSRMLYDPVQFSKILEVVPGSQIMVCLGMDAELNPPIRLSGFNPSSA